ncbi:MAG: ABC transporter substrate-binding protein [Planctomycetota bacterium]
MRLLPTILFALLLFAGLGLGFVVMRGSGSGGGLGGGSSAESAPPGGTLPQGHVYTGVAEEPGDVNPYTSHESVARSLVLANTHDTLLDRDPATGVLRGALAESWQVEPDGSACTFVLREGIVFSDGSPLRMADVAFGYELFEAGHLKTGFVRSAFKQVSGFEALDDRTFRLQLGGRHFALFASVGESWIVASKQFFVAEVRRRLAPGEAMPPVAAPRFAELLDQVDRRCGPGTGPYQLQNDPHGISNWRRRQELVLTRNELSWRRHLRPGHWNLGGFRVLFRDPAGARNALLRHEIDWYTGAQIDQLLASNDSLGENYRKLVYDHPRLGVIRVVWNCRRTPFDDVRVRRALGMLIERQQLVAVFDGAARPALAHAKLGSPAYPDLLAPPFDPASVRRLLREAGFDPEHNPLKLRLLAIKGTEALRRIVELFADAARRAGIELEVQERVLAAFLAERKRGEWDGLLSMQFFDSWCDPYAYLHSDGLDNEGGWSHAEADRLAVAARQEYDADKRAELWRQLHTLAHEQQPVALLVHPLVSLLLNRDLQDCEPGPLGLKPYRAWVAPELQRR